MKRIITLIVCVALTTSLCCLSANASTKASDHLRSYSATLYTGNSRGQLQLSFNVYAYSTSTSIGISQVKVYKSDGSYVKTIQGSTSNGLLASSRRSFSNTYNLAVEAGKNYYLEVTFTAKDSSGSDSKTYTTNTAAAAS